MPGNGQVCGFPVRDLVLGSKPVSSFTTLGKMMFVQYLSSDKCQRRLKLGFFPHLKLIDLPCYLPTSFSFSLWYICAVCVRENTQDFKRNKHSFNPFQLKFAYGLYLGISDSDSQPGVQHPHSRWKAEVTTLLTMSSLEADCISSAWCLQYWWVTSVFVTLVDELSQ